MYGNLKNLPITKQVQGLREEANMTQTEFAEYLGLSVRAVQSWEQGKRKPMTGMLDLIQRVLIAENIISCPSPFEKEK